MRHPVNASHGAAVPRAVAPELGQVLSEIQACGVRVDEALGQSRTGGAGPADAGMMWVGGIPVTFRPRPAPGSRDTSAHGNGPSPCSVQAMCRPM